MTIRLGMWSGPRNISTAMMRAWGHRSDTVVCDEPLYAYYLQQTRSPHPGADEVLAHHDADLHRVIDWLTGPVPDGNSIFYQKHMAHHLLPEIEIDWIAGLTNCFLIRDPEAMLTSLIEFLPRPTTDDTGLPQQVRIFAWVREATGRTPPVLDARDVLENPRGMLSALCDALNLPFCDEMLSWPPGRRSTDGVWARHWYAKVEQTATFAPYRANLRRVPDELTGVLHECRPLYEQLYEHRLTC